MAGAWRGREVWPFPSPAKVWLELPAERTRWLAPSLARIRFLILDACVGSLLLASATMAVRWSGSERLSSAPRTWLLVAVWGSVMLGLAALHVATDRVIRAAASQPARTLGRTRTSWLSDGWVRHGGLLLTAVFAASAAAELASSRLAVAGLWTIAVVIEATCLAWLIRRESRRSWLRSQWNENSPTQIAANEREATNIDVADEATAAPPADFASMSELIQQQSRELTRTGERTWGHLRANIAAGQRTVSLHVAFCPPMESTPKAEAKVIAGPSASVKVAEAQPYGLRLEVRIGATPNEPAEVIVWWQASVATSVDSTPAVDTPTPGRSAASSL